MVVMVMAICLMIWDRGAIAAYQGNVHMIAFPVMSALFAIVWAGSRRASIRRALKFGRARANLLGALWTLVLPTLLGVAIVVVSLTT